MAFSTSQPLDGLVKDVAGALVYEGKLSSEIILTNVLTYPINYLTY